MTVAEAMQLAATHFQAGRMREAEELCRAVIAQQPGNPFALNYLGVMLAQRGQHQEAVSLLRRSVETRPPEAHLYSNLAGGLLSAGDAPGAEAAAREALLRDPNLSQAHIDLGNAVLRQGRIEESAEAYRRAAELDPARYDAPANLGLALRAMGRYDEAIAELNRSLELDPNRASNLANLATVLLDAHRIDEAIATYRKALEVVPYEPMYHYSLGMAHLMAGDWAAGWPEFEWRLQAPSRNPIPRIYAQPRWDGSPLHGRTILLYTEEDPSDVVMFARYIPLVAEERGGRVVLECRDDIAPLLSTAKGVAQIVHRGQPLPHFDVHCSLPSLPLLFGSTPQNVPAQVPYLSAPANRVDLIRPRIDQFAGDAKLRVGISCAVADSSFGGPLAFDALAPLSEITTARWYNLGPAYSEGRTLGGAEIVELNRSFRGFGDVAAAIANLDLVITADTTAAHVAGALGKEVWLLLAYAADWRWMLDRDTSVWYPTMRIFRQPTPGDWADVAAKVTDALRQRAGE